MPSSSEKRGVRERILVSYAFGKNSEAPLVMLCGLFVLVVFCRFVWPTAMTATAQEQSPKEVSRPIVKPPAEQPVPFSHKLHLTFDIKCQECHPNPEPGDRMTLPAADRCMECHRTIAKDKPAIQKLAAFAKSKQTIPWVRIYTVSGWVFWNHRSHLESGMKCETCHGELKKMDVVIAATNVTTMAGCVDCHRKNEASTGCQYCHSGK